MKRWKNGAGQINLCSGSPERSPGSGAGKGSGGAAQASAAIEEAVGDHVIGAARSPVRFDRPEVGLVAAVIHDDDAHHTAATRERDELLDVLARAREREIIHLIVVRAEIRDVDVDPPEPRLEQCQRQVAREQRAVGGDLADEARVAHAPHVRRRLAVEERLAGAAEHNGRVERGGKAPGKSLYLDHARQRLLEDIVPHESLFRHRVARAEDTSCVAAVGKLDVNVEPSHRSTPFASDVSQSGFSFPANACQANRDRHAGPRRVASRVAARSVLTDGGLGSRPVG